jgi:hypothetical protein
MKYDGVTLTQIADELDRARRVQTGSPGELGECITMSDALARQIAARLREIDETLNAWRIAAGLGDNDDASK